MTRSVPSNIVMFSAEAVPFAKDGGLGDVVGALPKELKKLGFDPIVVIPAYTSVLRHDALDIRPFKTVPGINIPIGGAKERADIFLAEVRDTDVTVYLIGSDMYFNRPGIYNDPVTGEGYPDNAKRFIFFMKAGIELLLRLKHPVDIIHCHDSQTALIPGMLRVNYAGNSFYKKVGTLFTIHNLAYQGIYPKRVLQFAGIESGHFYPMSPFEYWDKVNFMKAGILLSDKVNTVSQTYAAEIQSSNEFGYGLEEVLHSRAMDLSGIVNGIDYGEWNPETDPLIPKNYSSTDFSGKENCKRYIQKYFNLPRRRKRTPLIGIVSRLADQKGFELIVEAAPAIASMNAQMVILGVGQKRYHEILSEIAAKYPKNIALRLAFDNELAHKIEAGSDIFLMPSRFEPCGLSQLISLRYGTIPVVRATGGLADTIEPYEKEKGTGFIFKEFSPEEMMEALKRAISVYSDADSWKRLMKRAMAEDWSWKKSAVSYGSLYRSIYLKKHDHG